MMNILQKVGLINKVDQKTPQKFPNLYIIPIIFCLKSYSQKDTGKMIDPDHKVFSPPKTFINTTPCLMLLPSSIISLYSIYEWITRIETM